MKKQKSPDEGRTFWPTPILDALILETENWGRTVVVCQTPKLAVRATFAIWNRMRTRSGGAINTKAKGRILILSRAQFRPLKTRRLTTVKDKEEKPNA